MRDLMLRFVSLGDNCELGFAQKSYQANPMDLFRWAATPAGVLLRLLRDDFNGIGSDLKVEERGRAFTVTNSRYGFTWHDWTPQDKASADEIAAREARRLPALAAKLRKELREGSRIFVVKRTKQPMSEVIATRIHEAMSAYGMPVLLYVTEGEPVSVSEVQYRLFHGTVPAFADSGRVPATTKSEDWLELCRMAGSIVDERYPTMKPQLAVSAA